MKRVMIVVLIISLLLCCTGCGAGSQTDAMEQEWRFTYDGTVIAMHGEAAPIISALGEPNTYTEETSCAFDGLDKTYFYGSFYMTTYPMEGKDLVHSLWFADDSVATEENIRIGSTQAEVEAAYGADSFNGTNAYTMSGGESRLMVILTDGTVTSILYEAITE